MSRQDGDLSRYVLRLVKNAELPQHRPPVVDCFPSQTVIGIESVHTAKPELDSSSRRRETQPSAEMCTSNEDFHENRVVCDMSALYLDL
jgi:hypothetical protein